MKNIFDMIKLYRTGYYVLMVTSLGIFSCLIMILFQDQFSGNFNKIKLLGLYNIIAYVCAVFSFVVFLVFRYAVKVTEDILKNGFDDVNKQIKSEHTNNKGEDVTKSINKILEDGVADRIDEFMIKNINSNLSTFICEKEAKTYFHYMGKTKTGKNVYIMKY